MQEKSSLFIKQETLPGLAKIDALILDVDGVILDVSHSFRAVICEVASYYAVHQLGLDQSGPVITPGEIDLFKFAGGFNDDVDLALAVVALLVFKKVTQPDTDTASLTNAGLSWGAYTAQIKRKGGGFAKGEAYLLELLNSAQRRDYLHVWQAGVVRQLFQELYGGDDACEELYGAAPQEIHLPGAWSREMVLLKPDLLGSKLKLGLLTGRSLTETRLAMRHAGLGTLISEANWVTADDGVKKPDGQTLRLSQDRLGFKNAIYVGDTMDDLKTVTNYKESRQKGEAAVTSAIALTGPAGTTHRSQFLEAGAEIVTPDINALLQYLAIVQK